jgi:hypothetical protein
VELYARTRLALLKLGVSAAQQRRAMRRSQTLKVAPVVSGPLMREIRGLGELLLEWTRAEEYLDDKGKPRILRIAGDAPSFEELARRFLPQTPLPRAVDLVCATAEVARRPGRRLALLGSTMVSVLESRDALLAHTVRVIDQLLETVLHNTAMGQQGRGQRRPERMVIGVIEQGHVEALMQELRPQITDLLLHVETAVKPRRPASRDGLKGATAVSVAVIVAQEDDWARAGIEAAPLVSETQRRAGVPRSPRGDGTPPVRPRRRALQSTQTKR